MFSIRIRVAVWTDENDTKTISVDANRFENGTKQFRFQGKRCIVWTGSNIMCLGEIHDR